MQNILIKKVTIFLILLILPIILIVQLSGTNSVGGGFPAGCILGSLLIFIIIFFPNCFNFVIKLDNYSKQLISNAKYSFNDRNDDVNQDGHKENRDSCNNNRDCNHYNSCNDSYGEGATINQDGHKENRESCNNNHDCNHYNSCNDSYKEGATINQDAHKENRESYNNNRSCNHGGVSINKNANLSNNQSDNCDYEDNYHFDFEHSGYYNNHSAFKHSRYLYNSRNDSYKDGANINKNNNRNRDKILNLIVMFNIFGIFIYLLCGFIPLCLGYNFMDYSAFNDILILLQPLNIGEKIGIIIAEIGVCLVVASSFAIIYFNLK